jgi:dTDP-4-dehydrorhamnose reductase
MKILVIGGSGVIGFKLVEYFNKIQKNVEYTYHTNKPKFSKGNCLDITQKKPTIELITKVNPDIIIHTVALTNVDLCETDKELANLINVKGTENILEGCKITNSKIVYISTSFVFNGEKKEYFEDDITSPATYYGITKLKAEQLVVKSGLSYLILRTDQPYCCIESWQHTNSVLRVIDTLKSEKVLKEITDWYNTPTYVPDFVSVTKKLIDKNITGIFHVVGPDFVNRYDMSLKVAKVFGLNKNMIESITSGTLNLAAKRVNVNLNNEKAFRETGIEMRNFTNGLMKMLK